MFKVNQKRPRSLRGVMSFLMDWNNPQRDGLVQDSILGGWLLWALDRISVQRSSWCWVAASLELMGSIPTMQGNLTEFPLGIHKIHCCQLQTRPPKVIWDSWKNRERWARRERRSVERGREERVGGGRGGKGVSSAFWILSSEGAHGPNTQVFEGSVATGTSDQGIESLRELSGVLKLSICPRERGRIAPGKPRTEHDKTA